ncbi:MAG TPA: hypothetical protein VFO40_11820, partial [Chthoniobacterales bacterium]|nr:hypothetical protein [Chthoniobacterales bacterium]
MAGEFQFKHPLPEGYRVDTFSLSGGKKLEPAKDPAFDQETADQIQQILESRDKVVFVPEIEWGPKDENGIPELAKRMMQRPPEEHAEMIRAASKLKPLLADDPRNQFYDDWID